jgi:heterodisulfide reductase subunit D
MGLGDLKADIYKCAGCNCCREMYTSFRDVYLVCPVREKLKFVSYTGRGRLMMARGILEKALDYTPEFIDHIYTCLQCGMCSTHCPAEIDKYPVVQAMRVEIVARKLNLPPGLEKITSNVRKTSNIFGKEREKRDKWADGLNLPPKAETVYFAGCLASYKYPEIAQSVSQVLKKGKIEFTILGKDEWCCGNRAFATGAVRLAAGMAEHNVRALEKMGAKEVIFSCAEGYRHFRDNYPGILGRELNFRVVHLSEYMSKLLEQGKIKFKKKITETITYHDPCALGRNGGIYEEPRAVLDSIPGLKRVEMKRNRNASWCCGAGEGVVKAVHPDLSTDIATDTVNEALGKKLDIIVSACPTCKWNFEEATDKLGAKIKVWDMAELVAQSLKS